MELPEKLYIAEIIVSSLLVILFIGACMAVKEVLSISIETNEDDL